MRRRHRCLLMLSLLLPLLGQGGEEVLQAQLRPTETKRVTGRPGQVLVVRAGETTAMEVGAGGGHHRALWYLWPIQ